MKKLTSILVWIAAFTAGLALAASPAFADTISDAVREALDSFSAGNYSVAAILVVVALTAAARKYLPSRYPFWRGDLGGSLLVLGASFAATLAAGVPAAGWSWSLLWTSAKVAAAASGGYTLVKRIGGWLIGYASARGWIPGWANVALTYALKMFQPKGEAAIVKAEAAGAAAVEANPGEGLSGPTDTLR